MTPPDNAPGQERRQDERVALERGPTVACMDERGFGVLAWNEKLPRGLLIVRAANKLRPIPSGR